MGLAVVEKKRGGGGFKGKMMETRMAPLPSCQEHGEAGLVARVKRRSREGRRAPSIRSLQRQMHHADAWESRSDPDGTTHGL